MAIAVSVLPPVTSVQHVFSSVYQPRDTTHQAPSRGSDRRSARRSWGTTAVNSVIRLRSMAMRWAPAICAAPQPRRCGQCACRYRDRTSCHSANQGGNAIEHMTLTTAFKVFAARSLRSTRRPQDRYRSALQGRATDRSLWRRLPFRDPFAIQSEPRAGRCVSSRLPGPALRLKRAIPS
jgi:hypothetical protein